jgi:Na+-transporting NADH:ubiquinone oxidoreductase subunit C
LYGYLALQSDGETVMGITFYKHGETPGLGGEVEAAWFTDNFKGKKIFDGSGNLTSITIWKGAVPNDMPEQKRVHVVDGISGATMTGSSVNIFLKDDLKRYESFLQAVRRGEKPAIQGV